MLPSANWLYLGANTVWPSRRRLTIPSCVFDERSILPPDRGAWWIYDRDATAVRIANRVHGEVSGVAEYAELSDPGDGSQTRFFTIPGAFRDDGGDRAQADDATVPREVRLDHGETVHFVSAPDLVAGQERSCYLFTLDQLEARVDGDDAWAADPRCVARLLDSEASHLIDVDGPGYRARSTAPTGGGGPANDLSDRLNVEGGEVPDEFTIERTTVGIEDVPPAIHANVDLKYLLVPG